MSGRFRHKPSVDDRLEQLEILVSELLDATNRLAAAVPPVVAEVAALRAQVGDAADVPAAIAAVSAASDALDAAAVAPPAA